MRQRFLDAIHDGQPFRTVLLDLGLTPNQVWGPHQDRSGVVGETWAAPLGE